MPKNFRTRRASSSSSSSDERNDSAAAAADGGGDDTKIDIKDRIEELKFIQKQRQRTHGIDVYSLAIGESTESSVSSLNKMIDNDPWKTKTGGLVDMKLLKEKRGNEIVKNMNSNFARETNQRDEDAEMQKFIEEQVRLKKEADRILNESQSSHIEKLVDSIDSPEKRGLKKYKSPDDAIFDLPKYLIESHTKAKTVELLSDQMLSGIPEVELGVEERIRNIEETERAKQSLLHNRKQQQQQQHNQQKNVQSLKKTTNTTDSETKTAASSTASTASKKETTSVAINSDQYAPQNTSINFVQHKRFDDALINPDHMIRPRMQTNKLKTTDQNQPVVGDAPKHELLAGSQQAQASTSKPSFGRHNHSNKSHHSKHKHSNESGGKKPTKRPNTSAGGANATNSSGVVERASDDYCLERFKKNMRFSRSSKIKIA